MYKVSDAIRATFDNDGAVVLDLKRGKLLRLNSTGSMILQHLQQGLSEGQIVNELSRVFGMSRETTMADLGAFLDAARQEELITIA